MPATAESNTTATEPVLSPKCRDDPALKLEEMDGEAALPLLLPLALLEPEAAGAVELPDTMVPNGVEVLAGAVTVTPKAELVPGIV